MIHFCANMPKRPERRRTGSEAYPAEEGGPGEYPPSGERPGQRTGRGAPANPEKSGGAKLRDCRAGLTAGQAALCSPDCNGKAGETR